MVEDDVIAVVTYTNQASDETSNSDDMNDCMHLP